MAGYDVGISNLSSIKMSRQIHTSLLPSSSPGTQRKLDFIHYGTPGTGKKAYLQAALHADEIPGLLVLHLLIQLLDQADRDGQISGHIVIAPIANPIGSSQHLLGELAGRYDQASGINFNRNYPDLSDEIVARIGSQLNDDVASNTQLIRQAAVQIISEQSSANETDALKQVLMLNAVDADIVLDLHCDWQAALHLYTGNTLWPQVRDLAAYLGAKTVLLAEESGGHPFDEALSGLWWALARKYPDKPIVSACNAVTIELRGKADVEEALAKQDAKALFYYLQSQGLIRGDAPPPPALQTDATPLDGVEKISAPIAGVVSYHKLPGERVYPGETVCTLFNITEYNSEKSRIDLKAGIEGVMYARRLDRLARPGQELCRIAGEKSISGKNGMLLTD